VRRQAAFACLPLAVISAFLLSDTTKWQKVWAIVGLIVIIAYNLVLAGRTIFMMIGLSFVCASLYMFLMSGKKMKFRVKTIIIFAIAMVGIILLYVYDIFGIKTAIMQSNFYERFFGEWGGDIKHDSRFDYKILYLKNMWGNFFGGQPIYNSIAHYAHDLFLDTYDYAGIFALIAVIGYILLSLRHCWKCISDKTIDFKFRQVVFCVYFICYLEFMIEPILLGMQWLFAIFCLFDGLVSSYLKDRKKLLLLNQGEK